MFCSGMRESVSGEVTFPEMDPDLFECVIKFVYTGDIELTRFPQNFCRFSKSFSSH
jgi:hypothetical protein